MTEHALVAIAGTVMGGRVRRKKSRNRRAFAAFMVRDDAGYVHKVTARGEGLLEQALQLKSGDRVTLRAESRLCRYLRAKEIDPA